MLEYDLPVTTVKHRGFFDYSKVQQAIRQWYVDDDYDTFDFKAYKQKFPTPTGTEHEVEITGSKKVTEYVKFRIDVFMRVYNMRDVELVQGGKKVRMQEGQVQVEVRPFLTLDWQFRFEGRGVWRKFLKSLEQFYNKYIIKYKIGDYWEDMILAKSGQLAGVIRSALGQEVM